MKSNSQQVKSQVLLFFFGFFLTTTTMLPAAEMTKEEGKQAYNTVNQIKLGAVETYTKLLTENDGDDEIARKATMEWIQAQPGIATVTPGGYRYDGRYFAWVTLTISPGNKLDIDLASVQQIHDKKFIEADSIKPIFIHSNEPATIHFQARVPAAADLDQTNVILIQVTKEGKMIKQMGTMTKSPTSTQPLTYLYEIDLPITATVAENQYFQIAASYKNIPGLVKSAPQVLIVTKRKYRAT